ncbi:MAG: sugar O-acetyltransferase [Geminicoccaceae bacterium]
MSRSEREKMAAGAWYRCVDPELERLRARARAAVHEHNTMAPDQRGAMAPKLEQLFAEVGADVFLEAPFHCAYGFNIRLGDAVYLNAGCVILDTAPVRIGKATLLGPDVQIYRAEHRQHAERREAGLEIARPVEIGANVWVGGGAILLGGIRIGDDAIVGAGAVVTRDVAPGTTVVGNPARAIG